MVLENKIQVTPAIIELPIVRIDSLPEGLIAQGLFQDDGCSMAASCIHCPFSRCRYDGGGLAEIRRKRDNEIRRKRANGMRVDKLADWYKLSPRTIHRVTTGLSK